MIHEDTQHTYTDRERKLLFFSPSVPHSSSHLYFVHKYDEEIGEKDKSNRRDKSNRKKVLIPYNILYIYISTYAE